MRSQNNLETEEGPCIVSVIGATHLTTTNVLCTFEAITCNIRLIFNSFNLYVYVYSSNVITQQITSNIDNKPESQKDVLSTSPSQSCYDNPQIARIYSKLLQLIHTPMSGVFPDNIIMYRHWPYCMNTQLWLQRTQLMHYPYIRFYARNTLCINISLRLNITQYFPLLIKTE